MFHRIISLNRCANVAMYASTSSSLKIIFRFLNELTQILIRDNEFLMSTMIFRFDSGLRLKIASHQNKFNRGHRWRKFLSINSMSFSAIIDRRKKKTKTTRNILNVPHSYFTFTSHHRGRTLYQDIFWYACAIGSYIFRIYKNFVSFFSLFFQLHDETPYRISSTFNHNSV